MASEKEAALTMVKCRFDKIINKQIPAKLVFDDDEVLAFRDIAPQAPTHILLIPKDGMVLTGISKILGPLLYTAKLVAKQEVLEDGFRLVMNDGSNGCMIDIRTALH